MTRFTPLLALALPLVLAGCAQTTEPDPSSLVRICDDSGCSYRPRNSATFNPAANDNPVQDQRIAALEEMAGRDPRAAYDLGLRYFRGDGVPQNSHLALTWMRRAGESGHTDAQLALGRFYLSGMEEMGSDPAEAERWLAMAASRGNKEAARLRKEASAARQRNQQEYDYWVRRYRDTWYGYWHVSAPYYWVWRDRAWYRR